MAKAARSGAVFWPLIKTVDGMAEVTSDAAALAILAGGLSAPPSAHPTVSRTIALGSLYDFLRQVAIRQLQCIVAKMIEDSVGHFEPLPKFSLKFWVFRLSYEAGIGDYTAEARRTPSKQFLVKQFSDLCELCASVVNTSSQKTWKNQNFLSALT